MVASSRRNLAIAATLILLLAAGAALLPSAPWVAGLAALLALAGVVLLAGNRWRSGALVVFALAVAVGLLDLLAGMLAPAAIGHEVVHSVEPRDWIADDPVLGYRPRPGGTAVATATLGSETVFRATYRFNADGTRATPAGPAGGDTYLFLGDSFMFGQGIADGETLPAVFAAMNGLGVRTINLAAPGYAPNHWVRALETGRPTGGPVKAAVAWIIPAHLDRVTGDGPWLGSSPHYALEAGVPRHTGSFTEHRWRHPLEGLRYVAGGQLAFINAMGREQYQAHQIELFVALMVRLRDLVRDKLGAPLVVIYSWSDDDTPTGRVIGRLREAGIPLVRVNDFTRDYDMARLLIPHDGHPTLLTNKLIAQGLLRQFKLQ